MQKKLLIAILILTLIFCGKALAIQTIEISGLNIPLIEGSVALAAQQGLNSGNMHLEEFTVNKPVDEVVNFYKAFLKENNFVTLGGNEFGGCSVSAKKGQVMFTLKIYAGGKGTIIQFIW